MLIWGPWRTTQNISLVLAHLGNSGDMTAGQGAGDPTHQIRAVAAAKHRSDTSLVSCLLSLLTPFFSPGKNQHISLGVLYELLQPDLKFRRTRRNVYVDTSSAASVNPGLIEYAVREIPL